MELTVEWKCLNASRAGRPSMPSALFFHLKQESNGMASSILLQKLGCYSLSIVESQKSSVQKVSKEIEQVS